MMNELSSTAGARIPAKYLWAGAFLALLLVECLVIYVELTRHSSKPWFFQFVYAPIMVSIPFTTGWPLYRNLKRSLEVNNCEVLIDRISGALATLTLISYLALSICFLEFL
jgi:hypothetical protein